MITIFTNSMMLEIKSKSEKRLIVEGIFNSRKAHMLIDTGATCGLIDARCVKPYKLRMKKYHTITLAGAGGTFKATDCETPFLLGRTMIYQFYVADISDVISSIKRQTGIEIQGIISLPQCKVAEMEIDTDDNLIRIKV